MKYEINRLRILYIFRSASDHTLISPTRCYDAFILCINPVKALENILCVKIILRLADAYYTGIRERTTNLVTKLLKLGTGSFAAGEYMRAQAPGQTLLNATVWKYISKINDVSAAFLHCRAGKNLILEYRICHCPAHSSCTGKYHHTLAHT